MNKIRQSLNWANKRLALQGSELDEGQIQLIEFAIKHNKNLDNNSLWPDDLLSPLGLLKARLDYLETTLTIDNKEQFIDEFKKAIKLIESIQ